MWFEIGTTPQLCVTVLDLSISESNRTHRVIITELSGPRRGDNSLPMYQPHMEVNLKIRKLPALGVHQLLDRRFFVRLAVVMIVHLVFGLLWVVISSFYSVIMHCTCACS